MNNSGITAQRILPEKLSNGDQNTIKVEIKNKFQFPISCLVIDEIPIQFQVRDFEIKRKIAIKTIDNFTYNLRPTKRGVYQFGNLNVYVSSPLNLASKRFQFDSQAEVPNYPSFLQLRKYNLLAFSTQVYQNGIKKNAPNWTIFFV